ncbi:MAG: hypothetical protein K8I27_07675 [Planctomycetes bacterium]|nr:hypothetical protein [Planctomycetota bacterium]
MAHYRTVVGIDEAGLGPILGPLTVGYSAFALPKPLTPDALMALDMWDALGLSRNPKDRKHRPVVCDSKKLHNPAKGIGALEEETLGWIRAAGHACDNYADFYKSFCAPARECPDACDWYGVAPQPFPVSSTLERADLRAARLARSMESAGYSLQAFGVSAVLEGELNRLMHRLGNKARAEFDVITRILGPLWEKHRQVAVLCDRQGGRTRYGRALHNEFPEARVEVFVEEKEISSYELSIPEVDGCPRLFIAFIEKGDGDHLPIALASMGAKYVREIMMHQFNAWFANYDAELKPTAGYFKDGRRWLMDSAELRRRIGVDDARLIRRR